MSVWDSRRAPTAEERAEAGAAWFDLVYPEWWQVVDPDRLDMGNGCRCVAGQTFTPSVSDELVHGHLMQTGFDALMWLAETTGNATKWVMENGFLLAPNDVSWTPLQEAWRRIIETRRAAAAAVARDQGPWNVEEVIHLVDPHAPWNGPERPEALPAGSAPGSLVFRLVNPAGDVLDEGAVLARHPAAVDAIAERQAERCLADPTLRVHIFDGDSGLAIMVLGGPQ